MTRQTLINSIHKLHVEEQERKADITNHVYIFQKYPHVKNLYEQHKRQNERWHQLVREILFYDSKDIRYMYDRTMQLIRRIGRDTKEYFKIKTELGTYELPDRLSDFNRLLELHETFFCTLFPGLMKRINLDVIREEHKGRIVRRNIHWAKTLNDPSNSGLLDNPLLFTMTRPLRRFDVPENIVLILSILQMKYDSIFLSEHNFIDPLSYAERETLVKIAEGCNNALRLTTLQDLIPLAKKYALLKLDDPRILNLESQVYPRIREHSPQNQMFRALLQWRKMYRRLNLRSVSPHKTFFPLDRIESVDKMYELWILFELLDFLIQEGSEVAVRKFPREFRISTGRQRYTLFYEKPYTGWAPFGALPDFTIETDGEMKVVMDAKNWLLEDRKAAMYKMLGYMNNLDAPIGVLFFPTEQQLKVKRVHHGGDLQYHKNQCLFNCVLHPSSSPEDRTIKIEGFTEVFNLLSKVAS